VHSLCGAPHREVYAELGTMRRIATTKANCGNTMTIVTACSHFHSCFSFCFADWFAAVKVTLAFHSSTARSLL
jgi:hypothetical protein